MVVGHFYPISVKGFLHFFQQVIVDLPVIRRQAPHLHHVVDAALTVLGDADEGRDGVVDDLVHLGHRLHQGAFDLVGVVVVGGGEGQIHPALALGGAVGDGGAGDGAVGDADALVVQGVDLGVQQANLQNCPLYPTGDDVIPHQEGLGHQQQDPAEQVGQGALGGQGEGGGEHRGQGDQVFGVQAAAAGHLQDPDEVDHDAHHRADEPVQGLLQGQF